jgi:PAT family beta-lactamase induction signal transducer AmpG
VWLSRCCPQAPWRWPKVDYGLNTNQIASLQIYNTVASAVGCLLGGILGDRFGIKKTVAVAYLLTAMPTLLMGMLISGLGLQAIPQGTFYSTIIVHGFFFGMAYGVRNAIFMGMTNPAVAATQFTAFMGMANLAISVTNYWQGGREAHPAERRPPVASELPAVAGVQD